MTETRSMTTAMAVAAVCRGLRAMHQMRQSDLADLMGVTEPTVSMIESGDRKAEKYLVTLSRSLGVSVGEFNQLMDLAVESARRLDGGEEDSGQYDLGIGPTTGTVPREGLEEFLVDWPGGRQLKAVLTVMWHAAEREEWLTDEEIADRAGRQLAGSGTYHPVPSIGARRRDLRKEQFGGFHIRSQKRMGRREYLLVLPS